ncbi:MAG: TolC family protein [Elusimicrobia bacterium]|nr:TolC family protein [Elusimicrobiota bacterium]
MIRIISALLLSTSAAAADLNAAVEAAVSRSPALGEARARSRQAEAAGREASYSRLPRLSARASALRSDDPLFSFGELLQERRVTRADFNPDTLNRPGYRTAVRGSLELGMPLFTGFELSRARRYAALAGEDAAAAGGSAAQAVRLRTAEAFLGTLKARALLAELDARIASSEAEVSSAERLKKQGLVLGSDHEAALAILSGLKAWRARTAAEGAARGAELGVLVGSAAPEPSGDLAPWTPSLEDDEALVAAALDSRDDLRSAGVRRRAAGLRREAAAQSLLPTVDAFAAVQTAAGGFGSAAAARVIGVRAALPFGDPAYFSRRQRARADEDAASASREGLVDAVRGEVLARAAGLRGLTVVVSALDESSARARRSLEQILPLYREGRQSVMEVLRAEEAVARAADARLETQARLRSDWAALRAAQGRLDAPAVAELTRSLEAAR